MPVCGTRPGSLNGHSCRSAWSHTRPEGLAGGFKWALVVSLASSQLETTTYRTRRTNPSLS